MSERSAIRIGLLFSTTGPYATIGCAMRNGSILAIDEINSDPAFPFTLEDVKLLSRFNEVAALMEALETLPAGNPLKDNEAYKAVKRQSYIHVPRIISIMPPDPTQQFGDADFSPDAIKKRADEGKAQTEKALQVAGLPIA